MKKRMKMLALALVCLLLLGISGCSRKGTEVLIPVSMRFQDRQAKQLEETLEEESGEDISRYSGGYDFQYDKNFVLQKITVVDRNEEITQELTVTADEKGRIHSFRSDSGNLAVTAIEESFLWTSKGNLLTHTRVDGKGEQVLHREYDSKNRILSAVLTAPGKENVLVYEYAEDGKLVSATHYSGETLMCKTEFTCLDDGRLATETLLDAKGEKNATASYEYLEDGSTRITVTKKALISHETIVRDDGSTVTHSITPIIKDIVIVYTYDKAGFLIEEDHEYDDRSDMRYEYTYITVAVSKDEASRIFPLCKPLPALGILDQLTF